MMKEEFEKRCHKVSPEEYAAIEREYMELPDELDIFKDEFCELWIKARYGKVSQSVANYLLVTGRKENRLLQEEVKFDNRLLHEAYAEVKALKEKLAATGAAVTEVAA
jgi:catalase (peroxidase I)